VIWLGERRIACEIYAGSLSGEGSWRFALMVIVWHPRVPEDFDGLAIRTAFGLALADGVSVTTGRCARVFEAEWLG